MRFLFIGQEYPGSAGARAGSGTGTYLREITMGLAAMGHECHVVVWSRSDSSAGQDFSQVVDGIHIHRLPRAQWPVIEKYVPDSRDMYNLRRRICGLDRINAYDWIEIESEEGIALGVQKRFPDRVVLRIHTTLAQMVEYKEVPRSRSVQRYMAREVRSFREAKLVMTHSGRHAVELRRLFPFMGRIDVVPHGIDIPDDVWKGRFGRGRAAQCPRFLIVGSADMRKGFDRIRSALDAYREKYGACRAVIVSACDFQTRASFGLARGCSPGIAIEWLENIGQEKLSHEYMQASVLLHLARYESFGFPLVEAAAHGVPVVTTRVGIAPELLSGDLQRFIVDGDSPTAIADALATAVDEGEKAGAALRARYERSFTRQCMVRNYLRVLEGYRP